MNKKVECFEDLIIWRKAVEFAKEIYLITERKGVRTDFGLKNQIRNASVSISSNIAEGFERRSRKEYLNFLNIAKAQLVKRVVSYMLPTKSGTSIITSTLNSILRPNFLAVRLQTM